MSCLVCLILLSLGSPSWATFVFRAGPGPDGFTPTCPPQYLSMPLDHFGGSQETWRLKYYVNDAYFQPGGPLVVAMPQEGPLMPWLLDYSAPWASALKPVVVAPEHRFFGRSVPKNDSSVANYKYLSVEQSLKDIVALIDHMRASTKYSSISSVIAVGGSYSGALSAWIRRAYPDKVDAAIAHSPVVSAFMDFPQYGISNLVALSSPDSRCAYIFSKAMQAVNQMYKANKTQVFELFSASHLAHDPLGDFTFMYGAAGGAGLIQTASIQGGQKGRICSFVEKLTANYTKEPQSVLEYSRAVGAAFDPGLWSSSALNFTDLRNAVHEPFNTGGRPWWWMTCTELGWFQTGPRSGLSANPFEDLNLDRFLDTCGYLFPTASLVNGKKIADFNSRFGGADQQNVTKVFTVDYSDDPWKMATTTGLVELQRWPLGETQPFMLLTCDGCGHCGEGAPAEKLLSIERQELFYLTRWLGHPEVGLPSAILV